MIYKYTYLVSYGKLYLKGCDLQMQINVRENNVEQALRVMKKKLQREGIHREMKMRRYFEKPSEKKLRIKNEATRRYRKLERKRIERDGF